VLAVVVSLFMRELPLRSSNATHAPKAEAEGRPEAVEPLTPATVPD
jgi:hypothetical protein